VAVSKLNNGEIHDDALGYEHNIPRRKRVDSGMKSEAQRRIQEKKEVVDQPLEPVHEPAEEKKPAVDNAVKHNEIQKSEEQQSKAAAEAARSVPEIPEFNLAEQILAEQRKVSALRRKGPARARRIQAARTSEAAGANITQAESAESPVESIVSEIVARDIEEMLHLKAAAASTTYGD
jgi:hypothetical protein